MNKFFWNGFCFVAIIVALIIYACANRGYPQGGEKDVTPPQVIKEVPESFSTNFKGKQIDIYFDEYVQLKDINKKFVMSPPMKKKARVSLRGKYVRVTFQDSLKPNTTYTLDFADAIVDNNEGNPLGFYRYVFSTGPQLDSMELGGQVIDMQTQLPVLGATVMFYQNTADSVPLTDLPSYVAKTDSAGMFRVTNIKDDTYRVMAIDDARGNYLFVPSETKVGFIDSLIQTISFPMTVYDTIHPDTTVVEGRRTKKGMEFKVVSKDTIVRRDFTMFGPTNLFIPMFDEEKTQLYLVDEARKERERLDFTFSIPAEHQLKVRLLGLHLLDKVNQDDWYIEERSAGRDTIQLWIKDSLVYKIDSLVAEASYLRTDSLGKRVLLADTIKFYYKDKPEPKGKRKKEQDSIPVIKFMEISAGVGSTMDLNKNITLEFDRPIVEDGLKNIQLLEMVDSVLTPVDFSLKHDSLKIRKYYLGYKWKPETEYALSFPVAGTVARTFADEGRRVGKGLLLAELDPTSARRTFEAAEAALNQAKDACARLKQLYDAESLPEIKWVEAQTRLRQAEAAFGIAKKNLEDCSLYAPFSGVVGQRRISAGETALPGVPVLTLLEVGRVKVRFSVPEQEIARLGADSRIGYSWLSVV